MSALTVTPVTMSSREIARLTGKQHKNVVRDIREMLQALEEDGSDLSHVAERKDARGYTSEFRLDRELTETLLTGYSVPLRRKVVRRLHELEDATRPKQLQDTVATPVAALVDLAKLTLEHLPNLGENSKQALLSVLTEQALGHKVIPLPKVDEHLMPAGEVGKLLGISGAMVGRLANANGLKISAYGEYRLDKSKHSSKQVESFVYNAAGLGRLRELLAAKQAA
ncbi:phage regulatory protein Rha [Pseudomonas phage PS-1]|uniref:anti-repressor n=1 Tax=Pseudomonas phage PS-1 TaxID=1573458 RepID=UPI00065C1ECB|nr:anti-repressor [Pseudomonas phage PS-1]BAR92407.1 phage regulatory protein Rha [Pseudomonas phage PS-1]